jgi:hypothetical protein
MDICLVTLVSSLLLLSAYGLENLRRQHRHHADMRARLRKYCDDRAIVPRGSLPGDWVLGSRLRHRGRGMDLENGWRGIPRRWRPEIVLRPPG